MSGGYFDYEDRRLTRIEGLILEWLSEIEDEDRDLDFDELKYFGRRIWQDVVRTRKILQALDLYLSCDTMYDTFIKECRDHYDENLNAEPEIMRRYKK